MRPANRLFRLVTILVLGGLALGVCTVALTPGTKDARYEFDPEEIANLKPGHNVRVSEIIGSNSIDLMLPACPNGFRSTDIRENEEAEGYVRSGDEKGIDELIRKQTERAKTEE